MPVSIGRWLSSWVKASKPPAEAAIPTTGKESTIDSAASSAGEVDGVRPVAFSLDSNIDCGDGELGVIAMAVLRRWGIQESIHLM
jgi:hypothetical protein